MIKYTRIKRYKLQSNVLDRFSRSTSLHNGLLDNLSGILFLGLNPLTNVTPTIVSF